MRRFSQNSEEAVLLTLSGVYYIKFAIGKINSYFNLFKLSLMFIENIGL